MRSLPWLVFLAVGCEAPSAPGLREHESPRAEVRATAEAALEPLAGADASSSALALGRRLGRTLAFLADEDDARLRVLDVADGSEVAAHALGAVPGHVVLDRRGGIHVALRDADRVVHLVLAGGQLREVARVATPAEPIALGLADDDRTLLVSCGRGHALVAEPLAEGGRRFTTALAREPRGFAVDARAGVAVVAHANGSRLSAVRLADGEVVRERALEYRDDVIDAPSAGVLVNVPRRAVQGFGVALVGGRALVPMVLAYPGDPLNAAGGYGVSADALDVYLPHEPVVVSAEPALDEAQLRGADDVVDVDASRRRVFLPALPEAAPCLLPRAVAADAARGSLWVACLDAGAALEIAADGGALATSTRRRVALPAGPVAIALDRATAVAWSMFDRKLSRFAVTGTEVKSFEVPAAAPLAAAEGRRAFHAPRAFDGRSCASCHVDGRDDGITWTSPTGLVQTPILAGRLSGTGPFGWRGESATIAGHMKTTFERLRADKPDAETLARLEDYLAAMPSYRAATSASSAEIARGRELFHAPELGCSGCHQGEGRWTDASRRDVGTGDAFDTPSLAFLAGSAPYLHDGRYATLRELLAATDGKMGFTGQLGERDMNALIGFLMSM